MRRHRGRAIWLVAFTLLMKVIVPQGYMPALSGGGFALELCSGFGVEMPGIESAAMPMPDMPGMTSAATGPHGKMDHADRTDMPCGFAGHAPAAMAGTDPVLILLAIAFIVATVFRIPVRQSTPAAPYLRPPLRGPPALA